MRKGAWVLWKAATTKQIFSHQFAKSVESQWTKKSQKSLINIKDWLKGKNSCRKTFFFFKSFRQCTLHASFVIFGDVSLLFPLITSDTIHKGDQQSINHLKCQWRPGFEFSPSESEGVFFQTHRLYQQFINQTRRNPSEMWMRSKFFH